MFGAGDGGGFQICVVELIGLIEGDAGSNGPRGDKVANGAGSKLRRC